MSDKHATQMQTDDDAAAFNRRFKYAIIACAVIEFIALVILFYYKYYRRDA
jgi:hypothetical protein